jgi:hypothetical protein
VNFDGHFETAKAQRGRATTNREKKHQKIAQSRQDAETEMNPIAV